MKQLQEISEHISVTERSAVEAERLSVKKKQIEYLQVHVGEEFPCNNFWNYSFWNIC